jgi:hypothetical protein
LLAHADGFALSRRLGAAALLAGAIAACSTSNSTSRATSSASAKTHDFDHRDQFLDR